MLLLFAGQFVLLSIDEKTYHEVTRRERESAEKELLAQGFTHEQSAAVVSLVTDRTNDVTHYAQSSARSVGFISFLMVMLSLSYAAKGKS